MADKDQKKASAKRSPKDKGAGKDKGSSATPRFDPKPVHVGGDTLADRLLPHVKKIVAVVVGVAVILIVVFTVRWLHQRKHEKQTAKLAQVLDVADREVRAPGQAADPKELEPSFADPKARAEAVLDVMAKQGGSITGPTFRASVLLDAGKLDDAIAEYKKAQGAKGIEGVLAREGLGIALERKADADTSNPAARQKDLEDALAAYNAMQPDDKGPRAAWAHYHQGRVLLLLGKKPEAKAALEKAKDLGKTTSPQLVLLVDERLVALGAT